MPDKKPRTISIDNINQVDHCTECGGDVLAGIATLYKAPGNASWLVMDVLCQNCSEAVAQAVEQAQVAAQSAYDQMLSSRLN